MDPPTATRDAAGADLTGLGAAEAATRLATHGPNTLPRPRRPSLASRVVRELREPMTLLLVVAAAVSGVLLGEIVEAVAIVGVVALDVVIALVQEGRAVRALDALTALESRSTVVVRDGQPQPLDVADVVPGDVVRLAAGDRVPADLELLASRSLQVDEAVLTGESLPVRREVGEAVRAGTLVLRGSGHGEVTATGADTALGVIAAQLRDVRRHPTPLQRRLTRLTRTLGIAAAVLAVSVFVLMLAVGRGATVEEAFLTAVALAVAAVPEGLAAVTSVALALGVGRMARRGAIVRQLPAVETLGSVDVLVIDKTGTVTCNRMEATAVVTPDGRAHDATALPPAVLASVAPVLALCNDATVDPPTGDPTERALLGIVPTELVHELRDGSQRLAEAGFTSDRRRMSTVEVVDGEPWLLTKGAPEVVLPRCTRWAAGDEGGPLTDDRRAGLLADTGRRAARGERVLAVARRSVAVVPDDEHEVEDLERSLTLIGLVALRDPLRPSAADSVRAVAAAGATLVMATGDHLGTATAVAEEIGLRGESRTGDDLRADGIPDDPASVAVYARVDPSQKLALVERLQQRGHVVAVTGDGVNDAPALHRADIGVALGETGSDVAREAAHVVITDDDLATIVAAIAEGRGIDANLRKVVHYLVTSNLAEVAVVLLALATISAFDVPLHPLQLLWINLLTDGLPALALGVDPLEPSLLERSPRERHAPLLDGRSLRRMAAAASALTAGALASVWWMLDVAGSSAAAAQTVLFSTLVVGQVAYAYVVHRRSAAGTTRTVARNGWLHVATVVALLLQLMVVTLPVLGSVFDVVPLDARAWAAVAVGGLVPPLLLHAVAVVGHRLPGRRPGRAR